MHRYLCYKLNFPRLHLLSCIIKGAGGSHVIFHACIEEKKSEVQEQLQGKKHIFQSWMLYKTSRFSFRLPPKHKLADI